MALPPTESAADHEAATQESMFEDSTGYPELEAYEAADGASGDSSFEAVSDFSDDALEAASSESAPNSSHEPLAGDTSTAHGNESHSEHSGKPLEAEIGRASCRERV